MLTNQFYIQKSRLMLFPILQLEHNLIKPDNTYLAYKDKVKIEDSCLVCVYKRNYHDDAYFEYRENVLLKHDLFKELITTIDYDVIIFNLIEYKKDIEKFVNGKYSTLSPKVKHLIKECYKETILGSLMMETHLNPEDYHEYYAKEYGVNLEFVKETYETLSPPDLIKEKL